MRTLLIFGLFMICFQLCSSQGKQTSAILKDPNLETKVDALVKAYMDLDIFSGVVLIAERGVPVYHKAFGLADRARNSPVTLSSRFDIGSMNKSFTKVLILQLAGEGILSLDDKLGQYLDGFPPEAAEQITVEQLLNHRSGYGGYHTPEYWNIPMEKKSLKVAMEHISRQPLLFEPGTDQEYSNAGYVLLGLIAEKATGTSYFDLIEERIVKKLGMKDTYLREKYTVPNRTIGYYKNMRGELEDNDSFGEIATPAGGFYSTTSDMLRFYRAYHYGDALWDENIRRLDEMNAFYKEHANTGGAMTHAGGFEGANTVHYEILRDQISVLVFANMDEVVAENLGAGILAIIRGKEPLKPALPAIQSVYQAYNQDGIDAVADRWEALTVNFHPEDPKDLILNQIGYNLLFDDEVDDAIEIFSLNTRLFPGIANCWDSYGEALAKKGDKKSAVKAYRKALEIRPDLESARMALEKLEN